MSNPDSIPQTLAEALREIADKLEPLDLSVRLVVVHMDLQPYDTDEAKVTAACDAFAVALFGKPAQPREMHNGNWHHHGDGVIGPVQVATYARVESPQDRELERLKAELENLRARAGDVDPAPFEPGARVQIQDRDREPDRYEWATVLRAESWPTSDGDRRPGYIVVYDGGAGECWKRESEVLAPRGADPAAAVVAVHVDDFARGRGVGYDPPADLDDDPRLWTTPIRTMPAGGVL